MNRIAIYDGISVFVRGEEIVRQILASPERYNIQVKTDSVSGNQIGFDGRFKNFTIKSAANKRGSGVVLGGSLHKWKNKTHNHDIFLWDDFLSVYAEFLSEFQFDPYKTDIWKLEGGLNNLLGEQFKLSIKELAENILLLKDDGKNISRRKFSKDGYSFEVSRGECTYKFYDKSAQFSLQKKLLRTECSCKTRKLKKHGITTFADLVNYENHSSYSKFLLSAFESLLIFQPEILQGGTLSEPERDFILLHNNQNHWIRLKKTSNYHYKEARKKFLDLVDKHCAINHRTEILSLMKAQLS